MVKSMRLGNETTENGVEYVIAELMEVKILDILV